MGELLGSSYSAEKVSISEAPELPELLGTMAAIEPDGSAMTLTLHTTAGSHKISVPFGQASALDAEVRMAALLMLYRQTAAPAARITPLDELIHTALRPSKVSVAVDRMTGDRLFIQQFGDRMPRVVRMSSDAVNDTISEITRQTAAHAN